MNCAIFLSIVVSFVHVNSYGYSVIKEIDGIIYVGGKNSLSSFVYNDNNQKPRKEREQHYTWSSGIMNGSSKGIPFVNERWPNGHAKGPESLSYDTCLNWKQEHPNSTVRNTEFEYTRWFYYSPSGDFETMNYICMNSFIKAIQPLGDDRLWVCGTFGSFPRAFSVNKTTLEFIEFVDNNVMSCARYVDEPMATYINNKTKELYVASGWGLYRPDKTKPDVPDNNSTVLFSQWRLFRNLYPIPSTLGLVLSSDVNFIDVVKETESHIYFFGHEINSQYGLNNQDDRNAWQSFMLRVCKSDLGYKFPKYSLYGNTNFESLFSIHYNWINYNGNDYKISPMFKDIDYIDNLPTTHFVSPIKVNFGCYLSKRPRAISDNHFWGETNVVYLNKLADVHFDPSRKVTFKTKNQYDFGCKESNHSQIPLLGLFNSAGIVGTAMEPTGALCQLQINENIFAEIGSKREHYGAINNLNTQNAFEELMAISSTSTPNFFEKTLHRTNGFTLYPYWNMGPMLGQSNWARPSYLNMFDNIGKCHDKAFYDNLKLESFLQIQNYTNTGWPNEMTNRFTSVGQIMCQYYAAELYNFNATFVVPNVQFKKMFVIADNITNYVMHTLTDETVGQSSIRKFSSPLMVVGIISTSGVFYRVVVCDFDNGMINNGFDKTSDLWYSWCIFRHTDQPYLYRQFVPMEKRKRGEPALYRGSSLLSRKVVVSVGDSTSYPINRDPQFHVVKDVLRKDDVILVVTTDDIIKMSLHVTCSQYSTCVDCASDPSCMWHGVEIKCVKYDARKYNDLRFVQDVLDRGFKCITLLKTERIIKIEEGKQILTCHNAGFWRGNIIWKRNDEDISNKYENVIIDSTRLFISNGTYANLNGITCYGVKDDFDKLYSGKEYQWILNYPQREFELNKFECHILYCAQSVYIWKIVSIGLIVLSLLILFIITILKLFTVKHKWLRFALHYKNDDNFNNALNIEFEGVDDPKLLRSN